MIERGRTGQGEHIVTVETIVGGVEVVNGRAAINGLGERGGERRWERRVVHRGLRERKHRKVGTRRGSGVEGVVQTGSWRKEWLRRVDGRKRARGVWACR